MRDAAEATLTIQPFCRDCQVTPETSVHRDPKAKQETTGNLILFVMEPGVDGLPWNLCLECWVKGWRDAQPLASRGKLAGVVVSAC